MDDVENAGYQDDPDRVRERLQRTPPGDWCVFEIFSADGSLSVGITQGTPDPRLALVIYKGLTREVAMDAAHGLAYWYHGQGRNIALT